MSIRYFQDAIRRKMFINVLFKSDIIKMEFHFNFTVKKKRIHKVSNFVNLIPTRGN